MSTPLIPREIYLLERYCQPEPFEKVLDAWAEAVRHAESMLDRFMRHLPPDYRSRPLHNQPDRVWGELVLRNFRDSLQGLNDNYIALTHGDLTALDGAAGVESDLRGQRMDYPEDWMDEVEPGAADKFTDLARIADFLARPIVKTARNLWHEGGLTINYRSLVKLPLELPPSWPVYRLNSTVRVLSGESTPKTGIYLPDIERSFPALLIASEEWQGKACEATIPSSVLPDGTRQHWAPTTWTLVERVSDSGGGVPEDDDSKEEAKAPIFAMTRELCPCSGLWSPRADVPIPDEHVKRGSPMPMAEWREKDGALQQRVVKWQLVKAAD